MEQEMDTTDGPCFESLPVEIKQKIFSYCGTKTRQKITLVCKDWAEKLRYFNEDFLDVYLHHCFLGEDSEPFSTLINSTRRCNSLYLGEDIIIDGTEVKTRFLAHLGKDVKELDIRLLDAEFLKDPNFLLFFPQLKKLTAAVIDSLRYFKWFPETLEHVHLEKLKALEYFGCIPKMKNLNLLTSDIIQLKKREDGCIVGYYFNCHIRYAFSLENNLETLLSTMQEPRRFTHLQTCNINFIHSKYQRNKPVITLDDVSGIHFQDPPRTFHQFNEFPNLRKIRILYDGHLWQFSPPFCFNFHQAALCPKVEVLEIVGKKLQSCIECFKSMIDSFPNMKEIALNSCGMTNQHLKYICYKLPKLKHLETNSKNISQEIICNDQPDHSLGNLTQLETLLLPNFTADDMLLYWPFMPYLKKVQFGVLSNDRGLINFTKKTPSLVYFRIDDGSLLSDMGIELIAKNWPNLRTLRLHSTMPCDVSPIISFCRNLRTLELNWHFNMVNTYDSFFDVIPTLWEIIDQGETHYRYYR